MKKIINPQTFKILLTLILIVVFSFVALRSLISNPFYTSHDGFTHTARIASYFHALEDGQFPPRWATNLNGNMGSPIFTYIYPLPYFLGSLFHLSGMKYEDSFRAVMGLGYFLSGITSFFWLKNKFGNLAGFVGAVFFLWVPYHFLNLYVRASLAENLAYVFVPLIFLSIEKIFAGKNRWLYALAFSTAALFLSHNEVSALILPLAAGWIVLQLFLTGNKRGLFRVAISLAAGFAMASFIYLPDLFERNFIRFDQGISYYQEHFVSFWQLIRSPWGYGFDLPGSVNDAMSFQLGLGQILTAVLLFITIFAKAIHKKSMTRAVIFSVGFFYLVLGIAIFLMVDEPLIRTVWTSIPGLKIIVDFPWRLLGVTAIAFSFFAAVLVSELKNNKLVAVFLIAAVLLFNRNHLRINLPEDFSNSTFDSYDGTATAQSNEFTPQWHHSYDFRTRKSPVEIKNGHLRSDLKSVSAKGIEFRLSGTGNSTVLINRFFFPATTIWKDGKLLNYSTDVQIIQKETTDGLENSGLILIKNATPGLYHLSFGDTVLRRFGNGLSLCALIATLAGLAWSFKKIPKKH